MRIIRIRIVLIAIISLITMVPEFRIYSVSPEYTTKPIDAGRILESFDYNSKINGSIVITHKGNKLNAYADKLLDILIASFDMPGTILDWQSCYVYENKTYFIVLTEYNKVKKLIVFIVDQHNKKIVLSKSFFVSDTDIVNVCQDKDKIWLLLQDGNKRFDIYDMTGKKTCEFKTKILTYQCLYEKIVFVYNGESLTKYAIANGSFVGIKSITSFEVNSSILINYGYGSIKFTMFLFDRRRIVTFDQEMNVLFSKQVPDVIGLYMEGGFLEVASGSMFVEEYREKIISFDAKGYKYKKVNTSDFERNWYLYQRSNSFGLLSLKRTGELLSQRIVDDLGLINYSAFSGLPKDIQYVIIGSDENHKYWIYVYTMMDIYMIPIDSLYDTTFSIKTINANLPTNQNLFLDWDPYFVLIIMFVLAVFTKGFFRFIERMF
jgi:hypothetical protein